MATVAPAGMSPPGAAHENQAAMVNQMGGLLHLGSETMFLNPAGYDIKSCICSKIKCCCGMPACLYSFTPTIIYTNPTMTTGVEYAKKQPGCCSKARYEVYKLSNFEMGSGAQNKELMAYTYIPEAKNPCWWKCCAYPCVTTCLLSNPVTFFGGVTICCMGSKGAYGVLVSSETIEYGIKHGANDETLYTFQNDKSGCAKLFCCGLGVPQDDMCANCTALKNLEMYRNVHRTIFDGNSKDGTHSGQAPRQERGTITRTSIMQPRLHFPGICCCAHEVERSPMGSMQIHTPAGTTEEENIRMSLIMYATNAGWTLIDQCLDSDPLVRTALTVPVNSKGSDPHLHAYVDYSSFPVAVANQGILDTGNLIPGMKAAFGKK